MNARVWKGAIAKKCKQCVGQESIKYKAGSAELIEVCNKRTCGLFSVRPRIKKGASLSERLIAEITNDITN